MSEKKKELSVFRLGYSDGRTFRARWYNMKHFFVTLKWAWQRATKGYCDYDRYDIGDYYLNLISDSLREFAENAQGAPDKYYDEKNHSLKPWQDYLKEIAFHLDNSDKNGDHGSEELIRKIVNVTNSHAKRRWLIKLNHTEAWRIKEREKALEMLAEIWDDLWD